MPYSISNKETISETDVAFSNVTSNNAEEMIEIHSMPGVESSTSRFTPTDNVHICDICDARFKLKKHLNEHKRNIHTQSELLYICQYCNKKFNKK